MGLKGEVRCSRGRGRKRNPHTLEEKIREVREYYDELRRTEGESVDLDEEEEIEIEITTELHNYNPIAGYKTFLLLVIFICVLVVTLMMYMSYRAGRGWR